MAYSIERSKAPLVSADPNKHVVEEGFPLYLSKNTNRFLQYFPEEQVIERTNDFKPTPRDTKKQLKSCAFKVYNAAPELADLSRQDLISIISEDMSTAKKFEQLDPLKGNGLAITDYLDAFELYVFGGGPSMSNLVLLVSEKKQFDTVDFSVDMSLDSIDIKETIDLKYPIRQIHIAPLSTCHHIIFAVRTTSTIHLFTYDHEENLRQLHYLNLAEKSVIDPRIDYSMPLHVESSPYNKYEYLYTTNNGYTSVIDAMHDRVIFADIDPIPDNLNYISRWRSCAFGKTPFTILLASPECIREWNYSNDMIQVNTLAISNDRIVAFKTSYKSQMYCFATFESIVLMDSKRKEAPVMTWLHGLNDGLPSTIVLEELSNQNWRIIAFSNETQRATMMELHYVNNPSQSIAPTVKVLGLYQMPLSANLFDDYFDSESRIRSMGLTFNVRTAENEDTTKGYMMFSFTRLFEDGSVRVQYLALLSTKPEKVESGRFLTKPRFIINSSNTKFDKLLSESKLAMLPMNNSKRRGDVEVFNVKMANFESYLEEDIKCGLTTLTEGFKTEVASRVRQLKMPTTFRELFDGGAYQDYDLEDLTDFLDEIEMHEDIERGRQITIPGVLHHCKPVNQDLNRKLKEAYEKEIQLSKIIIHPLPHEDDPNKFQYLGRQEVKFASTTTSKVLSHCWSIDDSRFDNLTFPQYDTSSLAKLEEFPSVNIYKRRRSSTIPFPDLTMDREHMEDQEAIMPAVVKSTPIISKMKKTKAISLPQSNHTQTESATTQQYASTQVLSPHRPTTQSQSQSFLVPHKSANAFAKVSTQPVEGAFGSRKKSVQKKKKKTKSSGFK